MKFEVMHWHEDGGYHECRRIPNGSGNSAEVVRLKLIGGLLFPAGTDPEGLVGQVIEVDHLEPWVWIPCGGGNWHTQGVGTSAE